MKRFISFILILCVMSLLAVSFVSCDTPVEPNEETDEAESSESIDSETPQDTESKLPKTMVKDVEEWCKVFDFDNYTVAYTFVSVGQDETSEIKGVNYATPNLLKSVFEGENEVGWEILAGGKWYLASTEYSQALAAQDIAVGYCETQTGSFFENDDARAAFEKATYDEEKKAYLYSYSYCIGEVPVTVSHEFYIENGVLLRTVTVEEIPSWNIKNTTESVYTNIGNTVITDVPRIVLTGRPDSFTNGEHTYVFSEADSTAAVDCEGSIGVAVYKCSHCQESISYEYINGHVNLTWDIVARKMKCGECGQLMTILY